MIPLPAVGTIPLPTTEVVRHPRVKEGRLLTREVVLHPKEKAVRLPATEAAPHPATEDHIRAEEALHTTDLPEEYDAKPSFFSSKIHEL